MAPLIRWSLSGSIFRKLLNRLKLDNLHLPESAGLVTEIGRRLLSCGLHPNNRAHIGSGELGAKGYFIAVQSIER
jgi:hypothetical protein